MLSTFRILHNFQSKFAAHSNTDVGIAAGAVVLSVVGPLGETET